MFGTIFGVLTAHVLGGGLTWLLAVCAGALGNAVSALVHADGYRSVGASTGVFSLLGLLAAFEWARRKGLRQSMSRRIGPVFGGLALLAWLGVGDTEGAKQVDVVAHVTGLTSGALLGLFTARANLPERARVAELPTLIDLDEAEDWTAWRAARR